MPKFPMLGCRLSLSITRPPLLVRLARNTDARKGDRSPRLRESRTRGASRASATVENHLRDLRRMWARGARLTSRVTKQLRNGSTTDTRACREISIVGWMDTGARSVILYVALKDRGSVMSGAGCGRTLYQDPMVAEEAFGPRMIHFFSWDRRGCVCGVHRFLTVNPLAARRKAIWGSLLCSWCLSCDGESDRSATTKTQGEVMVTLTALTKTGRFPRRLRARIPVLGRRSLSHLEAGPQ
jgi:hypothetical protein